MKNSKSIFQINAILGAILKDQSGTLTFIKCHVIGSLALFAAGIALSGILSGCNNDTVDPGVDSEKTLLLRNHNSLSVPGPPEKLAEGLAGASGSTIGPGGALFVTEGVAGRISRIDPETGAVTTFASGLPPAIVIYPDYSVGGCSDVAFIGSTAYALITLVGSDIGGSEVVGIYRIDGPNNYTIIADIGAYSMANPPNTDFFVPTGVQYAIQTFRGALLVTDGHHNRILHVTTDGKITEFKTFGNIVPTGLALRGNSIYMAQAGPVPHLPENGKIVSFSPNSPSVSTIASGARLLVDVEFNRGNTLFGLSQGFFTPGNPEGSPANPGTGSLVMVNEDGTFTPITNGLDRPTSLEFIGNKAYIINLAGEVWTIENAAGPPFGI